MTLICFLLGDSPCRESRREARALSSQQLEFADLAKIVAQWHKQQCYFASATDTANTPHEAMAMSTDFEGQCFEKWASPPDTVSNMQDALMCLVTRYGKTWLATARGL